MLRHFWKVLPWNRHCTVSGKQHGQATLKSAFAADDVFPSASVDDALPKELHLANLGDAIWYLVLSIVLLYLHPSLSSYLSP